MVEVGPMTGQCSYTVGVALERRDVDRTESTGILHNIALQQLHNTAAIADQYSSIINVV